MKQAQLILHHAMWLYWHISTFGPGHPEQTLQSERMDALLRTMQERGDL